MVQERLNIYYLLDTTASMAGERIQQLNTVMQELKPVLEESSIDHNVEIVIRVIEFGNDGVATWHEGNADTGTPVERWIWKNLNANGHCTPTEKAIRLVADALDPKYLGTRGLRPVIILITDGCPDNHREYIEACNYLKSKIKGNTIRIAISVGDDVDRRDLEEFASRGIVGEQTNHPFVFEVNGPEAMAEVIEWCDVVDFVDSDWI
jgi:uncharacterized protein YegL